MGLFTDLIKKQPVAYDTYMPEIVVTPSESHISGSTYSDALRRDNNEKKITESFRPSATGPLMKGSLLFSLPLSVPYLATGMAAIAPGTQGGYAVGQTAASIGAGKLFDKTNEIVTGNTFGQNVSNLTSGTISPEVADFLNPGYWFGGAIASKLASTDYKALSNKIVDFLSHNKNTVSFNKSKILQSDFYKDLQRRYGNEVADQIVDKISSKEFQNFFLKGRSKTNVSKMSKEYETALDSERQILSTGNAALGGSRALAGQGTVNRSSAIPHDLDFNYQLPQGVSLNDVTSDNVFEVVPVLKKFVTNPIIKRIFNGVDANGVAYKTATVNNVKNGMDIDFFLRDTPVPKINGLTPSDQILGVKRLWGSKGKMKHKNDVDQFVPFGPDNPVISESSGSYSPYNFKENFIKDRFPNVVDVETYPGSKTFIPAVMNWQGRIAPIK